ncbi:MAG: tyrosine decarboxylase MfnA [Candidatus Heimdallarchaeaceae archaeon]
MDYNDYNSLRQLDINHELSKDFDYSTGKILSSMNSDAPPGVKSSFMLNIHRNLGDPALFPGTARIEKKVIQIIGSFFDLPENGTGVIISGGSEANITALWAIRNNWIKHNNKRDRDGLTILAPESVHISIDKAADILGLNLVKIPLTEHFQMDINALVEAINSNTIAVIGVAGTTALGTIDPLEEIDRVCTENNLYYHIDAAFGGFVIPFIVPNSYNLSFKALGSLVSMTVDLHKMGRVPINGGGLLWRDESFTNEIEFSLPYLVGSPKQITISGTRSGAAAIAFGEYWQSVGYEGYKENVDKCLSNTKFLADGLLKIGFNIPVKPVINILGVKPPDNCSVSIYELHKALWEKGWTTSIVNDFLRLVVMPATERYHLKKFLEVVDSVISNNQ